MTTIRVEKLVEQSKQTLRSYIFDFSNFESWWDNFNTQYEEQSQTITFSPILFFKLYLKLSQIRENEIQLKYIKSPFRGHGTWFLRENNEYQTYVAYTITIKGNNFIVDSFIKSTFFKWKHERDILKLLNKLNQI